MPALIFAVRGKMKPMSLKPPPSVAVLSLTTVGKLTIGRSFENFCTFASDAESARRYC
ncbi:hypothetical protein HMPREF9554_01287 [Treponema phagedenis F0421]|nr:hypothetical protein HMPREF9554_01287 [Treponema phagedenis F0421]